MQCPRCGREQEDGWQECIHCGVIFSKFRPRPMRTEIENEASWRSTILPWLKDRMFTVELEPNILTTSIQGLLLLGLLIWTVQFLRTPIEEGMESFMHLIHLPFHEAGHFVFSPFGRFIHTLGGTLGQLLVPAIVMGSFLARSNAFGASVAAWWMGQSFLDCAPYINDARAGELMLLGGVTGKEMPDYHDWEVMLGQLGWMNYDHTIARIFWGVGAILMMASLAWGGFLIRRQWRAANS